MDFNPILLAIPIFFTLMALELAYEAITKRRTYRLNDAITNINTGVLSQLSGIASNVLKIGVYTFLFQYLAPFKLPQGWGDPSLQGILIFSLAMLLWDFCYYWEHRMAHEINLFWGGHVVHHQSEEYNLSVALRQTSTGFIWGIPFYMLMALVGISPVDFAIAGGLNLIYQYWIHTEHIQKMPAWFEAIFNTPSHHRVHHGRDPQYLDKNYAGILIIWDRLFGTFTPERERPNYGVTTPLRSWNPLYANFSHYIYLAQYIPKAQSARDVFRILFNPPGWLPDYLGGQKPVPPVSPEYQKYNAHHHKGVQRYILVHFIIALLTNAFFFFYYTTFTPWLIAIYAIWIVWTTLMFGFLFESRSPWIRGLEILRLWLVPLTVFFAQQTYTLPLGLLILSLAFALLSSLAFGWLIRKPQLAPPPPLVHKPSL